MQVCLLGQISSRSNAFLEGLETTHVLRQHVAGACKSVKQLRKAMARVQAEVVDKAIRVPQLAQRQQVGIYTSLPNYIQCVYCSKCHNTNTMLCFVMPTTSTLL